MFTKPSEESEMAILVRYIELLNEIKDRTYDALRLETPTIAPLDSAIAEATFVPLQILVEAIRQAQLRVTQIVKRREETKQNVKWLIENGVIETKGGTE